MKKLLILLTSFVLMILLIPSITADAGLYDLNYQTLELELGNTKQIYFEEEYNDEYWYLFSTASPKYSTTDAAIATVDEEGYVTATGIGSATITVEAFGMNVTCKVIVKESRYQWDTDSIIMGVSKEKEMTLAMDDEADYIIYIVYDAATMEESNGISVSTDWFSENKITLNATKAGNYILKSWVCGMDKDGDYQEYLNYLNIIVSNISVSEEMLVLAAGVEHKITIEGLEQQDKVTFKSSKAGVATVDMEGNITAKAKGEAVITTAVVTPEGDALSFIIRVKVTNPKLTITNKIIKTGDTIEYKITGIDEELSTVSVESLDETIIWASYYSGLYAGNAGTCTVNFTIDGKLIAKKLRVYQPQVVKDALLLQQGKTAQIKYRDLPKGTAPISYKLSNEKVASVSDTGLITAKNKGNTMLTITFPDFTLKCSISVGSATAVAAIKAGNEAIGTPYSQENRMKEGFFDCSSFVWRIYKKAGLGIGSNTYAPTAANLAKYLVEQKKVVAYEAVNPGKLQPGDLIFYAGSDNGRYMNISHVDIFTGISPSSSYWTDRGFVGNLLGAVSGGITQRTLWESDSSVVLIARPVK